MDPMDDDFLASKMLTGCWLNQPIWKNMLVKLDHFPKDPGWT